jgi:hypothetical protein
METKRPNPPPRAAAFRAGLADARKGRPFRSSAQPGSPNRVPDYDAGWRQGRRERIFAPREE